MNAINSPKFSAYIGIDWADSKHDIYLQAANESKRTLSVIEHQVDKIDDWVQSLRKKYKAPIAVSVELSKGPIIYALQKYDCFVIFPIHPATLATYRHAFKTSRAKNDPGDAELALDMLIRYPERFKAIVPQSVEMRTLSTLVEARRDLVDDKTRLTNRLRTVLKQYYPQILEWFDRIDTHLFCDFVTHWPTLLQARRARQSTLTRFFREHHMQFKQVLERRLIAIKNTIPLTNDNAVIIPNRMKALILVEQLRLIFDAIEQFDNEIDHIAKEHDDYSLFHSLPGAGSNLTPRLMVAFGEQRERYHNAAELQQYAGVAPVTEQSGKKRWIHWRWQCSTFLRQTFVEWAAQTINKSLWAGAYYRQQRAKGCTHQATLRSLAFKWIRIVYRCWQKRVLYDELTYLKALQQRGSKLFEQTLSVETN